MPFADHDEVQLEREVARKHSFDDQNLDGYRRGVRSGVQDGIEESCGGPDQTIGADFPRRGFRPGPPRRNREMSRK